MQFAKGDKSTDIITRCESDDFRNIRTLKDTTDKSSPYYIYKTRCRETCGQPSYVFKSSTKAAEIALKMDAGNKDEESTTILQHEFAFMDGMHSKTQGYKTLTLWTYHAGMC